MTGQIEGQLSIEDLLDNKRQIGILGECVCRDCLYWWSNRCPYGDCYDDHRAKIKPYDKTHPDKPPRKAWSNWNKPGEPVPSYRIGWNECIKQMEVIDE